MINAEQIRMGRAYLDWSTADLAAQTNLTVNAINRIERGAAKAQPGTIKRIEAVFDAAGIEFLPFSGIKKKERLVELYEGEDAFERYLDNIHQTMRDCGGLVRVYGVDETRHTGPTFQKIKQHIEDLRSIGVHERLLIKEGDSHFVGPRSTYHWLPERYFSEYAITIYGSKVSLSGGDSQKATIVVINDPRMAESLRALFDFIWDHTSEPPNLA